MVIFDISVNGRQLYRTGVGEFGMLTAETMWARIQQRAGQVHEQLSVRATSLSGDEGDECHSEWPRTEFNVGDEIRIRVVDSDNFDEPARSGALDTFAPPEED
jgi:hypothetical protein